MQRAVTKLIYFTNGCNLVRNVILFVSKTLPMGAAIIHFNSEDM